MSSYFSVMKQNKIFILSIICLTAVIFVINPQKYMTSFTNGLTVWAVAVVPALFPFFFLSKLLIELDFFGKFSKFVAPITKKLFNAPWPSGYIFLLSVVSGYPVGAKLIEEHYAKGIITAMDCKKIATFTSTSGPLFILGTVAGKFFGNASLGWVLLSCHILSAVLCGLLFRSFFIDGKTLAKLPLSNHVSKTMLSDAIYSSVIGILSVGAFISIFYMLTDMLLASNIFQATLSALPVSFTQSAAAFAAGILEVTRGCLEISSLSININSAAVLGSFLISFGGFCVMLQSLCFLSNCGVSFKNIIAIKGVQASISAILTWLWLLIFPF